MDIINLIRNMNPSTEFKVNDTVKIVNENSVWFNATGTIIEVGTMKYKVKINTNSDIYLTVNPGSICLHQPK